MPTILSRILDDLKSLHENFKGIDVNGSGEAFIKLQNGNEIMRSEFDENSKTHQILEIYEQVQ